jgi:hypothetical protein
MSKPQAGPDTAVKTEKKAFRLAGTEPLVASYFTELSRIMICVPESVYTPLEVLSANTIKYLHSEHFRQLNKDRENYKFINCSCKQRT